MPAMIWDETLQAFKEADTPKIWNESVQAFADAEGKVYNGTEWVDTFTVYLEGVDVVKAGQDYILGSGAHTNTNRTIKVRCLSRSGSNAVMQTYGVAAEAWPGSEDLTSKYKSYFGGLASYISGVKLPTGSSSSNINPSGSYAILPSAGYTLGISYDIAWLGTSDSVGVYGVDGGGGVKRYKSGTPLASAPYFTLRLTNIRVNPKTPPILLAK